MNSFFYEVTGSGLPIYYNHMAQVWGVGSGLGSGVGCGCVWVPLFRNYAAG